MGEAESIFTGVKHVCVVTADVDRAVRTYADRYGLGPWRVFAYDDSNMDVTIGGGDADFQMRVGLCQVGGFVIELIQPVGHDNVYSESLAAHGGADHVHHLKLEAVDFGAASRRLEAIGLSKTFDGRFAGGDETSEAHGVYYDTEDDLGFVLEIGELTPTFAMTDPEYVYPPGADG